MHNHHRNMTFVNFLQYYYIHTNRYDLYKRFQSQNKHHYGLRYSVWAFECPLGPRHTLLGIFNSIACVQGSRASHHVCYKFPINISISDGSCIWLAPFLRYGRFSKFPVVSTPLRSISSSLLELKWCHFTISDSTNSPTCVSIYSWRRFWILGLRENLKVRLVTNQRSRSTFSTTY